MPRSSFDIPRYLRVLPLFKGLAPDAIERLTAASQLRRAARGEAVLHAGQPCPHYWVTVVGQVKLQALAADGQEKVIELAGPGTSFGETTLFTGAPCTFGAQALTETLLLRVDRETLLEEMGRDPALALRMAKALSSRLQGLMEDVRAYTLHSGQQRVIDYLLADAGERDRAGFTVSLPASKATIASRLSITPEYFSRVLRDLEDAGLIHMDRRSIRVPEPGRLGRLTPTRRAPPRPCASGLRATASA